MSIAHENYLETGVLTASPQKLQLLLIEAAIRSIHRGKQSAASGDQATASEHFIHAQDCIGQILAGLNYEGAADIVKKLAAVYVFVLRQLAEGAFERNEQKLDDAVRVLEVERETWRQVCEQFGSSAAERSSAPSLGDSALVRKDASARLPNAITTSMPAADADSQPCRGFCLDA